MAASAIDIRHSSFIYSVNLLKQRVQSASGSCAAGGKRVLQSPTSQRRCGISASTTQANLCLARWCVQAHRWPAQSPAAVRNRALKSSLQIGPGICPSLIRRSHCLRLRTPVGAAAVAVASPEEGSSVDKQASASEAGPAAQLRLLRPLIAPDRWLLLACVFLLTVYVSMWLQIPLKIGGVFDVIKLGPSSTKDALRKAVVELSTVFFFSSIFSAMQTTLATVLAERLATRMRKKLFRSIVAQELAFFDNSRKGELLSRLSLDISTAQSCLTEVVGARGLRTLFEVLGSTGLMLFTNWRLGLAVLALAPLGTWALQRVTSISATLARELQAAIARSMEMADERISQIRTVITFAQEAQEVDKFGRQLEAVYQVGKRAAIAQGALQAAFRVGLKAGTIVLFSYGGYLVAKGRMTVGTLLSYNVLNLIATTGVGVLLGSVGQLARVSGALERVAALMSRQPNPGSLAGSVRPDTVVGRLELRNLGFKYREEEGATWALKDVSFTVEPGSVVALVGPSGSGKSTLAALLLRLYEPTEGHVLLDGIPLDQLDPCWLRGQVGVVSQEPALFSGSIADNIAYARPEATRAEVMEAAAAANAEEFIVALPAGYDTQVGEKGASLSGGQRQRIAIARAVLKDPQILLLDEATSALDMESEVRVSAALKRLMKGRTTVLIAHRLSTVAGADWLVVLEKGRVREEGTPAQLALREGGLYQQMLQMAAGKGDAASLEMDSLFDQAGTKHETLRRRTA